MIWNQDHIKGRIMYDVNSKQPTSIVLELSWYCNLFIRFHMRCDWFLSLLTWHNSHVRSIHLVYIFCLLSKHCCQFSMSICIYWSLRLGLFLQVKILLEQFVIQEQFQGGGGGAILEV